MSDLDPVMGEKISKEISALESSVKDTHSKLYKAVAQREQEIADLGGVTSETKAAIAKFEARYDQEVAEYKGQLIELQSKSEDLLTRFQELETKATEQAARRASGGKKSVQEAFDASEAFKNWNLNSGRDVDIKLGRLDDYARKEGMSQKDITGAAVLRSILGTTNWMDISHVPFTENEHLRDYIPTMTGEGYGYAYVRQTAFANNAAFQVEGTTKATSGQTFEDDVATSHTLAHTNVISRQQARQTPQIVSFIQNQMLEGLYHVESTAILFADGTSGAFTGITNTPGIQTYNRGQAGDNHLKALRRSETQLQSLYLQGSLYVINHFDWEEMELLTDNEDRFLWISSPQEGGTARMWRKPIYVTPAMTPGQFLNGDFQRGCMLIDFERAHVEIFNQHADHAAKNMLFMRAEQDLGLAVRIPQAFVYGGYADLASGS
jgi:HK97 family phage major capsid protein